MIHLLCGSLLHSPMPRHSPTPQREDAHFRVLNLLKERPELSQRQIAAELGISLGRINYCLKALVDRGYVKIENFRSSNHKLGYLHVLTPSGISERASLGSRFLARKLGEYEALKTEIDSLRSEISPKDRTQ